MAKGMPDMMRIGDAERERAAEDLRTHVVAGRLTMEEYSERLEAVYDARTFGDLRPVMIDLPPLDAPGLGPLPPAGGGPDPFVGPLAAGALGHRRRGYGPLARAGGPRGGIGASMWMVWILVAITLTTASHGLLWPVWFVGPLLYGRWARRGAGQRWRATGRR